MNPLSVNTIKVFLASELYNVFKKDIKEIQNEAILKLVNTVDIHSGIITQDRLVSYYLRGTISTCDYFLDYFTNLLKSRQEESEDK